MKITNIILDESNPSIALAFETEPPMSDAVFKKLQSMGMADCFRFKNGRLLMPSQYFDEIDPAFRQWAEARLTKAEDHVAQDDNSATDARHDFVKMISERTGIPFSKSAHNAGDTDKK